MFIKNLFKTDSDKFVFNHKHRAKNMDLVTELSNELALTFLVEKRFAGKVKKAEAVFLIDKIKEILQTTLLKEEPEKLSPQSGNPKIISH